MVVVYWLFRNSTPVEDGQVFPQAPVGFGGGLQPGARLQRRAEDHGHHHRRAVHFAITCTPSKCRSGCCWPRYSAIALGTMSGGWRIVRTMGGRLTRLKPRSGFCAETGAAAGRSAFHLPGHAGLHHARDRRRHRRRRQHPAHEGRPLGHRHQHRVGLGPDHSGGGDYRLASRTSRCTSPSSAIDATPSALAPHSPESSGSHRRSTPSTFAAPEERSA